MGFFLVRLTVILGVFIHILYYSIFVLIWSEFHPSIFLCQSDWLLIDLSAVTCIYMLLFFNAVVYPHLINLLSTAQEATHAPLFVFLNTGVW